MNHATRPATRFPAARFSAARFQGFSLSIFFVWAVLLLLSSAAPQSASAQGQSSTSTVIDANAKIHVTVADEPQLTGDYTVDGDGNITMLYINQVHVRGYTPAQAAAAIRGLPASGTKKATGLTQFYVTPQVIVSIAEVGGIDVTVTGLVTAPRHYTLKSDARLNDVLQQAVPALNADLTKISLTHGDTTQIVNYRSFLENKSEAGNPLLRNGDVVSVTSHDPLPISINIQGQVSKPGRFQVSTGTTAYSALQSAGGPTLLANTKGIVIKHFGATDQIPFDFVGAGQSPTDTVINPTLIDGDTLIVPASPISSSYTLTGPGIRNPSEYALPDGIPISLASAIGKAGGLADRAKINQVNIIRTNATTRATQTILLDASTATVQGNYLVQPGDNITINQGSAPTKIDPFTLIGLAIAIIGLSRH